MDAETNVSPRYVRCKYGAFVQCVPITLGSVQAVFYHFVFN